MRAGVVDGPTSNIQFGFLAHWNQFFVCPSDSEKARAAGTAGPSCCGMDWTHAHLALNHIPVIGIPFLFLLLAWGWSSRADAIIRLSLRWTAGLAAISILLKFTGDFAAEEAGARFDAIRSLVNAHEQMADQATTAVFLLGVSSGIALYFGRGGRQTPYWALATVLAIGLVSTIMLALTANSGGQISHPELRPPEPAQSSGRIEMSILNHHH